MLLYMIANLDGGITNYSAIHYDMTCTTTLLCIDPYSCASDENASH